MNLLIIFVANYLYLAILAAAGLVCLRRPSKDRRTLVINGLVAATIGFGLTQLARALYYDPRPFVTRHIEPLIAHGTDNGFPSDHTVLTMLVALIVFQVSKRWGVALIVGSLLVGMARIAAHVHSPIDILGSIAIASIAALLSHIIGPNIQRKLWGNPRSS